MVGLKKRISFLTYTPIIEYIYKVLYLIYDLSHTISDIIFFYLQSLIKMLESNHDSIPVQQECFT